MWQRSPPAEDDEEIYNDVHMEVGVFFVFYPFAQSMRRSQTESLNLLTCMGSGILLDPYAIS